MCVAEGIETDEQLQAALKTEGMTMTDLPVEIEQVEQALVIAINRPAQRNAVNRAVSLAIAEGLDRLGWRTVLAKPGDTVTVPRGVAHWFGNAGPGESRARVEVRPALAWQRPRWMCIGR